MPEDIPAQPSVHLDPGVRETLVELGVNAAYGLSEEERQNQAELVASVIGEMAGDNIAMREAMLGVYDSEIRRAEEIGRRMGGGAVTSSPELEKKTVPVEVDYNKIGWLGNRAAFSNNTDPDIRIIDAERVEGGNLIYDLADLTGLSKITHKLMEELDRQGIKGDLMAELKEKGIPGMWRGLLSGRGIRPVSLGGMSVRERVSGGRHTNLLLTRYPAYKLDVQGTKNRALLLILGKDGDIPRFGLAAMYDHDDDVSIHRHMYSNPA